MTNFFLIFLGGGIGSVLRYLSVLLLEPLSLNFPFGTFAVNVVGSFLIGFIAVMLEHKLSFAGARHLLIVGLLGGFTTFSTFSFESVDLLKVGDYANASAYILGSVALCLLATGLGLWVAKTLFA